MLMSARMMSTTERSMLTRSKNTGATSILSRSVILILARTISLAV